MKKSESLWVSFKYAFEGYGFYLRTQRNARIHLFITILVLVFGFIVNLNNTEWLLIAVSIALVWMAELLNTSVENLFDLIQPEENKSVKQGKDVSAAMVLTAAGLSIVIGLIVFLPKLINWFSPFL